MNTLNQQEFRQLENFNTNLKNIESVLKVMAQNSGKPSKNPQTDELIVVLKEINKSIQGISVTIKDESTKLREVILKSK